LFLWEWKSRSGVLIVWKAVWCVFGGWRFVVEGSNQRPRKLDCEGCCDWPERDSGAENLEKILSDGFGTTSDVV
jgi:hypothetical protein